MKFLRRAVEDDKNLRGRHAAADGGQQVHAADVDGPEELAAGFPKTRDELFAYRGIILGSIEAGAFTGDQLRMIGEFVERRGGGLLMLGGARSFSEGGYAGTPVADALPVVIERRGAIARRRCRSSRLKFRPTRAGEAHAITQIAADRSGVERALERAAGAHQRQPAERRSSRARRVLLTGTDENRRTQPVLAFQRYGRGKALAFAVQDSWLYQMHASMPLEDMTHENLGGSCCGGWSTACPSRSTCTPAPSASKPGEPVTLTAEVVDKSFVELNDARVVAQGKRSRGQRPSRCRCSGPASGTASTARPSPPRADGMYAADVEATREGKPLGTGAHARAGRAGRCRVLRRRRCTRRG